MPNRLIKESIKRSPQIDSLSWFEEVVFYRLIVTADDYGCMDARPILLKNELFPTKENITKKAIEDAIRKLVSVGLLCEYKVSGMPYLTFPTWESHQRIRNKHRKYPAPPDGCHLTADCCQMTAGCQSESNPNPNPNPNPIQSESKYLCAEPQAASTPAAAELVLNDGTLYPITEEQVAKWAQLYPAVDVMQQLRAMSGWIDANPSKRKTRNGILRFCNSWLSREQDKGGTHTGYTQKPAKKSWAELAAEMDAEESI